MESPNTEITISVNGSKIRVTGANGCTLSVYNVTGVRVMSVKIDSADKQYDLDLPKGCYILQIGKRCVKYPSDKYFAVRKTYYIVYYIDAFCVLMS